MYKSVDVDAWFEAFEHPLKEAMLLVRDVILGEDDRMTEVVKWSAPTVVFKANLASLQARSKNFMSLMFHRGSEVPGDHPLLQGDAPLVRVIRFADTAAVGAHQVVPEAVAHACCELKAG